MTNPDDWLTGIEARFHEPLKRCAAGLPANVALMQILMECETPQQAETALVAAIRALDRDGDTGASERLYSALRLSRANPDGFAIVRAVLDAVDHESQPAGPDDAIARCAAAFDHAARQHPEGSVALYSLGNPALLEAATAEIVTHLQGWGVLPPNCACLDIGCGIGRFELALSPYVASIIGIDISAAMVEAARRRCAHLPNVQICQTSGRDLFLFAETHFDLVLAVDSFPYLVQAGGDLAGTMIAETARVLRPGGRLVILNFSYRGDIEADRRDIARHAERAGLSIARNAPAEFRLWDAAAFVLRK